MEHQVPTDIDEMGKPRHVLHGKRGAFMETRCKDGVLRNYIWQRKGADIVRGHQRGGIKAADFEAEAVSSNEKTSPRVEVPRVVIETMQFDIKKLSTQDVAIYWRLFAQARYQGIGREEHTISLSALKRFVDVKEAARIKLSLKKLLTANMSLHVNQPGAHGRVGMPMFEGIEIDDQTVTFRLPQVLRTAVLHSRDYAWIDINAISRFRCKFSAVVFLRMSYEAGKHWSRRSVLNLSRTEFRDLVGLPEKTQTSVLEDVIARVRDDVVAVSGPRRRFKTTVEIGDGPSDRVFVEVGSAQFKLKEVKPKGMTQEAIDQVKAKIDGGPALRMPTLVRARQAATLLKATVWIVVDEWSNDLESAERDKDIAGLSGRQFLDLIDQYGANDILEFWVDKRDFSRLGYFRQIEDVGAPLPSIRRTAKVDVTPTVTLMSREPEAYVEDLRLGDEQGILEYGIVLPPAVEAYEDVDDMDIPF